MNKETLLRVLIDFFEDSFAEDPDGVGDYFVFLKEHTVDEVVKAIEDLRDA